MGINPTPTNYKSFTFDGKSSREFGVYTTGEGVYNAPERAVEMISIPARNGDYALDLGHFENIEVKYRCGIVTDDETDFAEAVSDFRNWLCSRRGYCRITDEYNPDEYRMGLFKSVIEVDHDGLETGEFDVTFDCKPQRWLKSGEEAVTIGEWGETETVSGEVVEVEATEADAVKSLVADINAEQDLNGYDAPWVGGAGKNKGYIAPQTKSNNGITYTVDDDGVITANGTLSGISSSAYLDLTVPTGTYLVNGSPSGASSSTYYMQVVDDSSWSGVIGTSDVSVTITSNNVRLYIATKQSLSNVKFYPMFRASGTSDDFEPYENICPISGHTEVDVVISPTTDAADGNTYTTALGQTVYGGTLDLISGELTVTHKKLTLDGTQTLTDRISNQNRVWIVLNDMLAGSALDDNLSKCDKLPKVAIPNSYTYPGIGIGSQGNAAIYITGVSYISGVTDLASLNTWLTNNPVTLTYPLATPTTYQLTPQQIELLLGTNNIWADSGDVTLEYGQNPSVLVNPTPFDSSPLLETEGYGTINFNGYSIELADTTLGLITLANSKGARTTLTSTLNSELYRSGDDIKISALNCSLGGIYFPWGGGEFTSVSATSTNPIFQAYHSEYSRENGDYISAGVRVDNLSLTAGTAKTESTLFTYSCDYDGDTVEVTAAVSVVYTPGVNNDTITITNTITLVQGGNICSLGSSGNTISYENIQVNSTADALGHPTYIDCDIGECYMIKNDEVISLNQYIDLGSDLPTLPPGATTVNYDNTITDLKIAPRWWKV